MSWPPNFHPALARFRQLRAVSMAVKVAVLVLATYLIVRYLGGT